MSPLRGWRNAFCPAVFTTKFRKNLA